MTFSPVNISVIIPFHGEKNDLLNCITALQNQNFKHPFEIIVVESTNDPQIKKLFNPYLNVNLISSGTLLFPGKARNIGSANTNSDLLVFLDADCIPAQTWLSEVYASLKNDCEIVIGPVTNLYPFHPVASIDNLLQFADFQKKRKSKNITHFPGCNLGITKGLFIKSGGFLEEISIGEDTKFSETIIKKNNAKISFNQKMIVRHSGRKEFIRFLKHQETFGFYRGYLKNGSLSSYNQFRNGFLFSVFWGLRRLFIIIIQTLKWNPNGIFRIIFYFPFLCLGLAAWVFGFWKGIQKKF